MVVIYSHPDTDKTIQYYQFFKSLQKSLKLGCVHSQTAEEIVNCSFNSYFINIDNFVARYSLLTKIKRMLANSKINLRNLSV